MSPRKDFKIIFILSAKAPKKIYNNQREGKDKQLFMSAQSQSEKQDLKDAGLKVTAPRVKILELFENSEEKHLSADDVYRILVISSEDIGIATVYRVLTQFEKAGILTRHNFDGEQAVFELNSGEHHDHLLCIKCGEVSEFFNQQIEDLQSQIAKDKGFKMTDHCLVIHGICKRCI